VEWQTDLDSLNRMEALGVQAGRHIPVLASKHQQPRRDGMGQMLAIN
jgi:hypothetical protein